MCYEIIPADVEMIEGDIQTQSMGIWCHFSRCIGTIFPADIEINNRGVYTDLMGLL